MTAVADDTAAFLEALELHLSIPLRCTDPGCPELLDYDRRRPNILRCPMHGPMLLVDEFAKLREPATPPRARGAKRPANVLGAAASYSQARRASRLERLLTWVGRLLDPGVHEVGF